MRYAVYDIGSNSVKFLAVERTAVGQIQILAEESHTTRLAEGLIASCELKPEAVERTLSVLATLKQQADSLGVSLSHSRAIATSAVRDSRNRKQFLKAAAKVLGFSLQLLSGDEEAEGIYRGIRSDPLFQGRTLFGVDVGGGSAEWILGGGDKILRRISLPLGCVRLRERFISSYPISPSQQDALFQALLAQLQPVLADYPLADREVVGTGGTLAAAAAIDLNLAVFSAAAIHRHSLTRRRLEAMAAELSALDLPALEKRSGIPPKRADIVVPGLFVFLATLRILGAEKITVSIRGLRYGILDDLMREVKESRA